MSRSGHTCWFMNTHGIARVSTYYMPARRMDNSSAKTEGLHAPGDVVSLPSFRLGVKGAPLSLLPYYSTLSSSFLLHFLVPRA
ncbi:unnamed protein product [Linum trigynum]|uniref:Uncharacterized protein n=1 Tax=Linum trigynum TaxID=586398 RepID=A0AAV2C8V7_9ROSI